MGPLVYLVQMTGREPRVRSLGPTIHHVVVTVVTVVTVAATQRMGAPSNHDRYIPRSAI